MNYTKHALVRLQQRAISPQLADLVWSFGSEIKLPGGVIGYRIPKRVIDDWIKQLKRMIHVSEKARGIVVVVSSERHRGITAYHERRHNHRQ